MKHLQSFIDKINDFKKAKFDALRLRAELTEDVKELVTVIVRILDEMTPDNTEKEFNINIESDELKIYKIINKKTLGSDRDVYLHLNGISTFIYWIDTQNLNKSNSLWNFNSGGKEDYKPIADILDGLIIKYNMVYKSIKYNI